MQSVACRVSDDGIPACIIICTNRDFDLSNSHEKKNLSLRLHWLESLAYYKRFDPFETQELHRNFTKAHVPSKKDLVFRNLAVASPIVAVHRSLILMQKWSIVLKAKD